MAEQLSGKHILERFVGPRVLMGLLIVGCWHDVELPVNNGSLWGQVLISGGVWNTKNGDA